MARFDSVRRTCLPAIRCLARGLVLLVVMDAVRAPAALAEDTATVEIADTAWTDSVVDRNCTTRLSGSVALHGPLYFWTRVNGRAEALETLRREGKLPISHEWERLLGPQWIWDDTGVPLDAIPLSVGREDMISQLRLELQNRHFFDWRTWSMKGNLTRGWWRVSLKYANGDDVLCKSKPCRYIIEVK